MSTEQTLLSRQSGRLDKVLADALQHSRNQIEKLIRAGQVRLAGEVVTRPGHKVKPGTPITYRFVEAPERDGKSVDFDVDILYEDDDLLVVNKPAGLVVHPAPSVKVPTLVDWLVGRGMSLSTLSGEERHGIVHRIDKDTTGALVVAKNNMAHRRLSLQLQDKSMGRYYLAVTDQPLKQSIDVSLPIARHPKNRLKMAVVSGGRGARTRMIPLAVSPRKRGLIAAKLFTGRTHQIRVHLGALNRHILGDNLYGLKSKEGKIARIYLHAYVLYLTHPATGKTLEIVAPLFDDMMGYMRQNFDQEMLHESLDPDYIRRRFVDDVFVQRV